MLATYNWQTDNCFRAKSGDLPEVQSRAGRSSREGARRAGAPTASSRSTHARIGSAGVFSFCAMSFNSHSTRRSFVADVPLAAWCGTTKFFGAR